MRQSSATEPLPLVVEPGSTEDARHAWYTPVSVARRLFIVAIVAIALGGPMVEAFDRWDQTLKDGNDTEANAVIAALCIGAALAVGTIAIAGRIRALSATAAERVIAARVAVHDGASLPVPVPTSSPPAVLRV